MKIEIFHPASLSHGRAKKYCDLGEAYALKTLMDSTDIRKLRIIEALPPKVRPYFYLARLDRPVGVWLLLLPCLWSILLAAGGIRSLNLADWKLIGFFALGAFVMRPVGCIINDLWDRNLDKKVARTKKRPLASEEVKPLGAFVFLVFLLMAGFAILIQMNITTVLLGILTLPLIVTYPLMKRITWWPQAFLGLTFNFGALMGWTAVTATLDFAPLYLYVSCIFWTLGYDTIYAHQDKEDDVFIGVKSTARKFGEKSRQWVAGFYAASILFLCAAFAQAYGNWFFGILALPACFHFLWQIQSWDMKDPASSLKIFRSNRDYGLLVLILICLVTI